MEESSMRQNIFIRFHLIIFIWIFLSVQMLYSDLSVAVNDTVRLKAFSDLGVPLHPSSGNRTVSDRLLDGSIAIVKEIDTSNGWINISSSEKSGWIIQKYISEIISISEHFSSDMYYRIGQLLSGTNDVVWQFFEGVCGAGDEPHHKSS